MILSYHPCIEADRNLLCAGRAPDETDAGAISAADAVIVNQGCYESLYRMARRHCDRVFPNYDARFDYPGKIGQTRLFRQHGAPHPRTEICENLDAYHAHDRTQCAFPAVFKFDWGGEGETVFLVKNRKALDRCLNRAQVFERSGQEGFLIQEYVPHACRSLRVVVVHRHLTAYWRVQDDNTRFGTSVAAGARIDNGSDPGLREAAMAMVQTLCKKTGINLAGFDLLVPEPPRPPEPLFLEVNYFFGRRGLGGADAYYALLGREVQNWIQDGLAPDSEPPPPEPVASGGLPRGSK